ncbi:MAG: hypothetical protein LBT09_06085 [Planctomycetaceae bacterium]|nr:hypothetical protein [Planctomycetaceae bacterium]
MTGDFFCVALTGRIFMGLSPAALRRASLYCPFRAKYRCINECRKLKY